MLSTGGEGYLKTWSRPNNMPVKGNFIWKLSSARAHTHTPQTPAIDCCTSTKLQWPANIIKFHGSSPSCQLRLARWTHSHRPWQARKYRTAAVQFRHKTPTEHYRPIAASCWLAEMAAWQSNSMLLAACHQCTRIPAHDWHFWI